MTIQILMFYFDTSVIVAILTNEEASDRASVALERRTAEQVLLISDWSF
jgi:predicted nucleic acid-binding protein